MLSVINVDKFVIQALNAVVARYVNASICTAIVNCDKSI